MGLGVAYVAASVFSSIEIVENGNGIEQDRHGGGCLFYESNE